MVVLVPGPLGVPEGLPHSNLVNVVFFHEAWRKRLLHQGSQLLLTTAEDFQEGGVDKSRVTTLGPIAREQCLHTFWEIGRFVPRVVPQVLHKDRPMLPDIYLVDLFCLGMQLTCHVLLLHFCGYNPAGFHLHKGWAWTVLHGDTVWFVDCGCVSLKLKTVHAEYLPQPDQRE